MPIFNEDSNTTVESEIDTTEETTDESQENLNNSDETEPSETPDTPEAQKPEENVTDKGTKLADDPLSRANQLRANAEAQLKQAIDYIKYLKENQPQTQEQPKKEDEELFLDASKIQTTEDLQRYADSLKKVVESKYQELEKNFASTIQERQIEKTQESVARQIETVQSTYPELREFNADGSKNPLYNPVLDQALSDQIMELDYDNVRGIYRGSVDVAKMADRIVKSYRTGKNNGTESAKTKIIDKKIGSLRSTPPVDSSEENPATAESIIVNALKGKK